MKRPIPKKETRIFGSRQNDINHLANTYGDYRSCRGGRLVHSSYCCTHCGSVDPGNECYAPDPSQTKYLVQDGDAWVAKPPEPITCATCRKEFDEDKVPDRRVTPLAICTQCHAESGEPQAVAEILKWTRSL